MCVCMGKDCKYLEERGKKRKEMRQNKSWKCQTQKKTTSLVQLRAFTQKKQNKVQNEGEGFGSRQTKDSISVQNVFKRKET